MTAKTYASLVIWETFIGMGLGMGAIYGAVLRASYHPFQPLGLVALMIWGSAVYLFSYLAFTRWWPEYKRDFNDDHA